MDAVAAMHHLSMMHGLCCCHASLLALALEYIDITNIYKRFDAESLGKHGITAVVQILVSNQLPSDPRSVPSVDSFRSADCVLTCSADRTDPSSFVNRISLIDLHVFGNLLTK